MNRRGTIAALLGLLASRAHSGQDQQAASEEVDRANLLTFQMDALRDERAASDRPYLSFLELPSLRCGLYVLAAGAEDRQRPHTTDEIYYALSGRATIWVEGEEKPVTPGTVIYVKAQAEHRFVRIEEELELLVFFD